MQYAWMEMEQESDYCCLISSLIRSLSSSSIQMFRPFSILAFFCLWTSFSSASFFVKPIKPFHHADVFCSQLLTPIFRPVDSKCVTWKGTIQSTSYNDVLAMLAFADAKCYTTVLYKKLLRDRSRIHVICCRIQFGDSSILMAGAHHDVRAEGRDGACNDHAKD